MNRLTGRNSPTSWLKSALGGLLIVLLVAGCGRRAKAPTTGPDLAGNMLVGVASWYGHPFHGRHTASGEVYDMEGMTAAHQTLPFNTYLEVKNLDNGKRTVVRINDRGPFMKGRIIDLSRRAARDIDMIGPGTARVRLTVLKRPGLLSEKPFFTVQVGAFKQQNNAETLKKKLSRKFDHVYLTLLATPDHTFYRVRVGEVASLQDARVLADRLKQEPGIEAAVVLRVN